MMENDYISRAEVWQAIFASANKELENADPTAQSTIVYQIATSNAMRAIMTVPAADVRPVKRGKWIKDGSDLICLKCMGILCGDWEDVDPIIDCDLNFCPNCGADMKGETNGE